MKKIFLTIILAIAVVIPSCGHSQKVNESANTETADVPKVYWYKNISSENLIKIYEAFGREVKGKVAVKLSTGEPGVMQKVLEWGVRNMN